MLFNIYKEIQKLQIKRIKLDQKLDNISRTDNV